MADYIFRTLIVNMGAPNQAVVTEDQIAAMQGPLVIIGDPGIGKTRLTVSLAERLDVECIAAGKFYRAAYPLSAALDPADTIIIDGLDEIATSSGKSAVDEVLSKLSILNRPNFILSCRAADWDAAESKYKIQQDYGVAPTTLHLQPFSRDQALEFLLQFGNIDAEQVLTEIDDRGLADLYGNPLTLELVAKIASEGHGLPNSRTELFEKATKLLVAEKNPLHTGSAVAKAQIDGLLDSAGAIFAHLLLSGTIGIATGPRDDVPEGYVSDAETRELPEAPHAAGVVATRLFKSDGENLLSPIHRVIAEYLGARWLGKRLDNEFSQRRLFQYIVVADGVPSALRGLHAWLAHFCPSVADRCIRTDPFGILRYGDTIGMPLQRARLLLRSLEALAEDDPYFRSEDWGKQAVEGLTRPELRNEIIALITGPNRHSHLSTLLLEAMAGSSLTSDVAPELLRIVEDANASYTERANASEALITGKIEVDWVSVVSELSARGENDDRPLSMIIISRLQGSGFTGQQVADAIIQYMGLTSEDESDRHGFNVGLGLARELSPTLAAEVLDTLASRISEADLPSHWRPRYRFSSAVNHFLNQVIDGKLENKAERIWSWIKFLNNGRSSYNNVSKKTTEYFRTNAALRRDIQQLAFSETGIDGGPRLAIVHVLPSIGLGVGLTDEDLIFYLYQIAENDSLSDFNLNLWKDLVWSCRTNEGIKAVFLESIEAGASRYKKLRQWWDEHKQLPEPEWQIEQRKREAKYQRNRDHRFKRHRNKFGAISDQIRSGTNIGALKAISEGYFNLCIDLRSDADPITRLRDWLGDELSSVALEGFESLLSRNDLPTAKQIAEAHADGRNWNIELAMLCGVAEMVRNGQPLTKLPSSVCKAALASWWNTPPFDSSVEGGRLKTQLETAVFITDEAISEFLICVIEPHIRAGSAHVPGLYKLSQDDRFKHVAGPLALGWLKLNPSAPSGIQSDLLSISIKLAPYDDLIELIRQRLGEHETLDADLQLIGVSAGFLIDFEKSRELVTRCCENDPEYVWPIKRLVNPRRHEGSSRQQCSLGQLEFLVRHFAPRWSPISHPRGGWTGSKNPWDASDFIASCINGIADDPGEDSAVILDQLANDPAFGPYKDQLKHGRAQQRKLRRDQAHQTSSFVDVKHSLAGAVPGSVEDLKAVVLDYLDDVQNYIRNSDTKAWDAYWNRAKKKRRKSADDGPKDRPKNENSCRDRLIDDLRPRVPQRINLLPESLTPEDKRVDIIAIIDGIGLPIEIKGQWHKEVWEASKTQLDDKYTRDWRADGRGIYLVLWFGNVPYKNLPRHPDSRPRPTSPVELKKMLEDRLTPSQLSRIDIVVLDVSQPL